MAKAEIKEGIIGSLKEEIESLTGRRAHATFERWVHTVGMVILNDISRALEASQISAQLRSLWPF